MWRAAFFAYNGPGSDMIRDYTRQNPLAFTGQAGNNWVSCVRPTYGYPNGASGKRVKGIWKLLDCPTVVYTDPGNGVGISIAPHDRGMPLSVGSYGPAPVSHFRNYGYTDGHVEGFSSKYGYQ